MARKTWNRKQGKTPGEIWEIPKETVETGEIWGNVMGNRRKHVGNWLRRISEPLSYQSSSRFIHCRIHPRMSQSVHSSPFFPCTRHMVSYAKFNLRRLVANADQLFLSYHFMYDQPLTLRHQKCHKMSKYLVYLINAKTTCGCLTWIVLYKELY